MASTSVNVLRWSALAFGVVYGITHQSAIRGRDKVATEKAEYKRKEQLIVQAKQEWAKKHPPKQADRNGVISDASDPKFDLEAYLQTLK